MDWGAVLAWIANQGLALLATAAAAAAAAASYKAIKVTRAYQDPVFVMGCIPLTIDAAPAPGAPIQHISMTLINKGTSFARNVRWSANFDPFGISVKPQEWPHIEAGGQVSFYTGFTVHMASNLPVLEDLLARKDDAAYATVTFTSQSGHAITQKVLLPDPRDYPLPESAQQAH